MQFIKLPKAIDIAERVLPELIVDWVDTYSVKNIIIIILRQLRVNMLFSWVIEWSKSTMLYGATLGFSHIRNEPYETSPTMASSGYYPTQPAKRG